MQIDNFFIEHPIFRHEELVAYIKQEGKYNPNTLKALLQYHLAKEHISRIRRGYYAVTSALKSRGVADDPFLIAGRVTEDAIVAYHSALSFHGLAYSLSSNFHFLSRQIIHSFEFMQAAYHRVTHPKALQSKKIMMETKVHDRQGLDIKVTTVERTLVDCLNKPQFSGGWEEIWRAAEMINFLDIDRMITYAICLGNATTIAKVGFFLEQHQEQFKINSTQLKILERSKPKSKHYMERSGSNEYQYLKRWNLIVPTAVINKTWEEPNNDFI